MYPRKPVYLILLTLIVISLAPHAGAQDTYSWQVNYQHVVLDVDRSGSVLMTYEVDANIQQGVWTEVWIPETVSNMQVSDVTDGSGLRHSFYIDSGQIKTQGWDLGQGDHVYLRINATLPDFVYQSDTQGYDIVTFAPPYWDMSITDTQVKFYLPGNVSKDQVFTGSKLYDNFGVEDGKAWVYFQNTNLAPNEQFQVAVSFPDTYMTAGAAISKATQPTYVPPSSSVGLGLLGTLFSCCGGPFFFVAIILLVFAAPIIGSLSRRPYSSPVVSMDGIGINKDLDPVEAATLLRVDPRRILTMIMFGMMKKGNVKLISTDPTRLELVSRDGLNYYEKLFADAIYQHTLLESKLLECFKVLARRVVDKTRPYSRKETEDYYKTKIDEAWAQIKAVDTPELKLEKYDTDMFWLMADEQFTKKTRDYVADVPGSGTVYVPTHYWWYPYYFGLPHYYGTGAPQPSSGAPTAQQPSGTKAPTNQTTASVESFAKSITSSVESMSAGVVSSVDGFLGVRNAANAPPPATASLPAAYHSGGGSSCACVSCACACAHCACACACAGGGHGCT